MKRIFTPLKGILVALLFMLTSAVSAQTTATMLAFPEGCAGGIGASVDSMSFRISFTNNGMEAVTSVTVVDELPDGLDASGVTLRRGQPATPAVSLSGNTLTFTFSDIELAAGATGTLDYDVPFNSAGLTEGASLNNFATVTLESEAAVNTDTTTNSFMAAADIPVFEIGNDVVDDDPSNGFDCIPFSVSVSGGTPPYSYDWKTNDESIGFNTPDLSICPLIYLVIDLFVTDANGCVGHDQLFVLPEEVEAPNPIVAGDSCSIAIDINDLFGGEVDEVKTSEVIDLDNYTGGVTNSGVTCGGGPLGSAFQSTWLEFTGDGFEYQITTDTAALDNPLIDPLLLLFTGTCGDLNELVCSDDENGTLIPSITVETEIGVIYKLWSTGFDNPGGQNYRIKITRQGAVNTTEIKHTDINVYPNPTNGLVQLAGVQAEEVAVIDFSGRTVLTRINPGNQLDISALPAGVYTLLITDADQRYSARVIKE